jgi:hypothetical protein
MQVVDSVRTAFSFVKLHRDQVSRRRAIQLFEGDDIYDSIRINLQN